MTDDTPPKKRGGTRHKRKGDTYERDLADYLNERLFPDRPFPQIHRTPMSGSYSPIRGVGSADLTGTPRLWVEAKRTESVRPHEFMRQAVTGVTAHNSADIPVVITRRSRQSMDDSLVMLRLSDFVSLYHAYLSGLGYLAKP